MAGEDKRYIRWLHGRACACHPCAAAPRFIQAHHPRGGAPSGRPGMSQRSPDRDAFAICDKHHAQITDFPTSGYFDGWTKEELRKWEGEQSHQYRTAYETECAAEIAADEVEAGMRKAVPHRGIDILQGFPETERVAADIAALHGLEDAVRDDVERALRAFQKGRV